MPQTKLVWIVDDDHSIRWVLEKALSKENITTESFDSGEAMLKQLSLNRPLAVISDIRMPGMNGLELLELIHAKYPGLPVIIMTAHSDLDSAVSSYQSGAFEYLPKPFDIDDATAIVHRAIAHSHEQQNIIVEAISDKNSEIIGEAPAMQEVFRAIGRLSQSNITVLINGASGTGKELVAAALHQHSPRSKNAFVALNMAAIPHDLIESELFGHEKGSFTGAASQRKGRFEQADGGTLFLDEIGDMPADTQTRLLRVLADSEFYRIGGLTPVQVNVRIIAATHQNLEELVKLGRFREDLFHRLNVIRIYLPKLNERSQDIPQLARHFLAKSARELNVETKILKSSTENYLCNLSWPGNVRQLENTCHWITVMASGREVHISDLPPELLAEHPSTHTSNHNWEDALYNWATQTLKNNHNALLSEALPEFERILIKAALRHTHGKKREASLLLGWGRNTLTRKIKELNFSDEY